MSCNCKTDLTQASLVEAKLIQFIKCLCKCEGTGTTEPEEPELPELPEEPELPLPTGCSSNTLTTLAFPIYEGYGAPVTAHAKYRINNGPWVNYSVYEAKNTNYSDVFSSFLDSVTHNGARVFETSGNSSTAWFHCYQGKLDIIGGATQAPYSSMQTTENDDINPMLIEFEATTEGNDDLVRLAFGAASGSIYSCGLVGWTGL